ncbi:transcriptional regulator, SARP family [Deinococcus geothermalis DSM 11300]|uniref:Transcriptional regulator, SARP family n=1 Tax=Deinococcus geothermalis (strain DSM 11300 / CIP 105573 / AG-3a) TaxID=319795 RepID=Q1J153_DEIGD|nr:SARP family transcriptional regulator [Deinococcus geothermalis]ABF44781.1 transcriptional regulator, SARP family [Deinococcus geothermalis DSM 11300]
MADIEALFEAGQFQTVVTHLEGQARTARESTLLGIALIRVGRLDDAEVALTRAAVQGDREGQVELGNVLRALGRFEEAIQHFEGVTPDLTGELQLRALRWWGVAEFQAGYTEDGLKRVERAWHGYLALGDSELSARVTTSLAQMYRKTGNDKRAKTLLSEAVHTLPSGPFPGPRISALRQLLELHLAHGEFVQAREVLTEAKRTLQGTQAPRESALLLGSEAELCRLTGDARTYTLVLEQLRPLAEQLGDRELRLWTVSRLAEHYSLHGQHGKAVDVLLSFGLMPEDWPAELWATSGVIERRRGDLAAAEASLSRAAAMFREAGRVPELCRVLLHFAAACLRAGGEDVDTKVIPALTEAIMQLLRLRQLTEFKPDFEELSELLHYAVLEPETAPLMEPLLDQLAHLNLVGTAWLPEDGNIQVTVKTLGQMAVFKDGLEVPFTRTGCVPLLVYLALKPGRTRAQMQFDLWPDKEPTTGGAYVRQCLKELRDRLGHELIHYQGPHHAPQYYLGRLVHVDLDITHFLEAIERKEVARALALYRGEFLPGADPCDWIDTQRESLLLALTLELRSQMIQARQDGDHRRVVLLANQYLRIEPYDLDVLEERVASARLVASPQELARYTAELNRFHYN